MGMLRLKRRKVDLSQERKLLTNLIVSDQFCKEVLPRISTRLLKTDDSKTAFKWIRAYYENYSQAPKSNLQALFEENTFDTNEVEVENLGIYLTRLSKDFEQNEDYNVQYEIDQAKIYLRTRQVEVSSQEALALLERDKLDKAEQVLTAYAKREDTFDDIVMNIKEASITSSELVRQKINPPTMIIQPWLTDGNISMIYAPRGIGKTWLTLTLSVMMTRKKAVSKRLGPWEVMNQSGVLYVDGEMGEFELQSRIAALERVYGEEDPQTPLTLLTASRYARSHGAQINISTAEYRDAIYQYLYDNEEYQVVVLDNISSLTPGLRENTKEDWDPVNQWLISLRHLGVAIILVHHSGKGNQQRGTSGREDALDCIINLRTSPNQEGERGACFTIAFQKSRNIAPGPGLTSFHLALIQDESGEIAWKRVFPEREEN